ncbi:MAG: hypothetical protein EXQ52_04525 [Bryobacterales bacterium]|nr:hypothetical protein [Bryobacterales bacterium]
MTKKNTLALSASLLTLAGAIGLVAQQSDILIKLTQGDRPVIAVIDFRGAAGATDHMNALNQTLFGDLESSGLFKMAAKAMYPVEVPQRPEDFKAPLPPPAPAPAPRGKKGRAAVPRVPVSDDPPKPIRQGPWLTDWSAPPVNANYLVFGYAAVQGDQLVLFGWLYNVAQPNVSAAHLLGKRYFGAIDAAGAQRVAHEFAADIIAQFGGKTLLNSKIYFVSDRTGSKEVWSMDPDGSNQKRLTSYNSISIMPAVSPDGTRIAFTTFAKGNPAIYIHSAETGRRLPFYNQVASMNATPDFTPDGKEVLYSSTASGYAQIYVANVDGGNLRRISTSRAIEVEPKVNPKNPSEMVFVSGRSGPQQIYKMNLDGANVERLTTGEGEAANPAWHPDGQLIAFAWTRGFEPGNFNLFLMDVASRRVDQLTHGAGRNENPSWAPDGRHVVFSSNRGGSSQIWTMLADGTQLQKLTTQGRNSTPVWGK